VPARLWRGCACPLVTHNLRVLHLRDLHLVFLPGRAARYIFGCLPSCLDSRRANPCCDHAEMSTAVIRRNMRWPGCGTGRSVIGQ
jgi:hypothetical protein